MEDFMDRDELFFNRVEEDEELAVIDLEEDDGTVREYAVMAVMALDDFEKDEEDQEIGFLRYTEEEDGFVLDGIDNEAELQFVSDDYFSRQKG